MRSMSSLTSSNPRRVYDVVDALEHVLHGAAVAHGGVPSTFAMRSSPLAFAEQMRAVRLSTCALHMASSWGAVGFKTLLVHRVPPYLRFRGTRRRRRLSRMPIQSPAKDLRKTFAGDLFGRGREMGSAQPSESPSQGLCSDRGAKRSQNSPPKDLEKLFKGRCAVADPTSRYSGTSGQKTRGAPVVRMLPLFGKRTPARDRRECAGL